MPNRSPWLGEIPSTKDILADALKEVEIDLENPSLTARKLEEKCHEIYRRYEAKVREKWKDKVPIDKLELSLSQSRVSRAGHTVELILQKLLDLMGIEYERNKKINEERLDFVIPNVETLKKDPKNAPDNIWFVSLYEPPEYAVKTMTKLNIRVYVPDEFYEKFKEHGARRFSEMFEDLRRFRRTRTLTDF